MVTFTCNSCYETTAVAELDDHLKKCASPVQFKCVGCLNEFDDAIAKTHMECSETHTSVATSAVIDDDAVEEPVVQNDLKDPKSMQEKWVNFLQSIGDEKLANLSEKQIKAFNELKTLKNVPRNKLKFANFLKVSQKGNDKDARAIWEMILREKTSDLEIAFTEVKEKKVAVKNPEVKRKRTISEVDPEPESDNEDGAKSEEEPKKPVAVQKHKGNQKKKFKGAKKKPLNKNEGGGVNKNKNKQFKKK